ncbi:MAG TPA: hypothetical protein DCE42_28520 [Myxococcales bacterium]|nr:hypothetical protein [Deltaproteobacteria bacterium]MBU54541.1 hypothetical protein [Deltaproteobacteria bacterium]HAA58740.1 hypothetical protein [Myxococcales bacterium]
MFSHTKTTTPHIHKQHFFSTNKQLSQDAESGTLRNFFESVRANAPLKHSEMIAERSFFSEADSWIALMCVCCRSKDRIDRESNVKMLHVV